MTVRRDEPNDQANGLFAIDEWPSEFIDAFSPSLLRNATDARQSKRGQKNKGDDTGSQLVQTWPHHVSVFE